MIHRPLTSWGIRIRLIFVAVFLGFALGGYLGARWVSRNDSAPMQAIFMHDYLPQRMEQALGIEPLHGLFQPANHAAGWMQQFPVATQMGYWRTQYAGRIPVITGFALSAAILFALLTLRMTRRRLYSSEPADGQHLRRRVPRPWD